MTDARLLGGRYELGGPLGYGGMAEVHRGRDLRLGRDVAVKVLRSDLARDPGFQARFRREAQNAAALNHPSIVAVYDTGEDRLSDGTLPFIVMEYVEGRTLKEVLVGEGRLMPQRALEITADICAALDFSHRNGIIHRDMKPGNVMMTPNGTVKVMDFGIARALSSATAAMTQTSAVIGTAQYLSPEQARGEPVDARSDVYSTGCLLYELLCGHPPFTGDNPVSVAYQHVREDPIPPGELNPDVTPEIDAIVLKAMAKNPINRYQSAGEMRADLLRAAAGRPVAATPVYSQEERTQIIGGGRRGGTGYIPTEPVEEKPQRKALTWVLVILGVIAVFALAAFLTSKMLGPDGKEQVEVANVVGKPVAEARAQLEGDGFEVQLRPKPSTAEQKDKVLGQSPPAGTEADEGSTVNLDVGAGPATTDVPNLEGLPKQGAEAQLAQAKLKGDFKEQDSAEDAGTVLRQEPAPGTQVPENYVVTVWVSNGQLKLVPDVIDDTQAQATDKLQKAGFKVRVSFQVRDNVDEGRVFRQDPDQGTEAKIGTQVTIYIAKEPVEPSEPATTAPPSEEPTKSPSPTPTTTPTTLLPTRNRG
jgi:beta-lactam-binding protein with PASTA domain/predicted Ser/Thr protein kinase